MTANGTSTRVMELPGVRIALTDLGGGHTVSHEEYGVDADPAPLFRGLPGDRCQCPHWGRVLEGRITLRYADGEESFGAGEAYHARPGHVPLLAAGTRLVEFSPTDALERTIAVIGANLEAAGAAR